ncbi:MAG: hypothetical protein HQ592_00505, partial [Planctomycetes bacterium]|nr:hypothetical protein [Planctomycetota bacterium]
MNRIVTAVCLTFCVPALVTGEVSAEENGFVTLEGIVDTAATSAEPGAVPATLADGSSILDWKAEPKAGKTPHVYTVRFKEPVAVGTVVVYGKCRLSYEVGGRWSGAAYNGPSGHRLRFIPLPPRTKTTAVRITVEPQMITRGNQTGLYGSSVVFFGILSRRRVNVAANAAVVVSSAGEPSRGFQPVIGLNQSWALVDGVIDRSRNFYSRKRKEDEEPISEQSPEWIMLAWENEQEIAGLMLGRGSSEKGLGNGVIETYVGKSSPRFALGEEGWQPIGRDFSEPMKFRSLQMLDLEKPARTRAVRVKSVGGVDRLSVGEVIALVDLEDAPAPVFFEKVGGLKGIPFEIPGPGKVTIQVRDAEGNVVANPVAGEQFPAGKNIAGWDLKTIDGDMILTPDSYSWRGLYNPGLLLDYKFTYYPYPVKVVPWHTPDKSGGWLADHEAPKSVARQGDTMWLGAFAESGDSIIQVDTDMNKLWGEYRIWLAEPGWVCADGEWMFYLAEGGWMGDRQVIIQVHGKTHRSRRIFVRDLPQRYRDDVNGFQVVGNKAFISGTKINSVRVYDLTENLAGPWRGFGWKEVGEKIDAELPRLVKEIPLEKPGRVRKYGDGKVITTSGNDLVLIDVETYEVSMLMEGKLTNPMGLGVDDKLNIYVGEGDPLHQVVIYSPDGRLLKTLGTKGRREIGPFDEDNLDSPSGVEVGPLGRVWVAEHTDYPKRVSVWDVDTGKCVKAVYGPTQYGGGGCIDPGDDSRMFYKGIEFRRDRKTGEITIPNLLYRPDSKEFADFDARNFPSYAFRAEGKLWFTSAMAPHGHSIQVLWQY